MLSKAKDIRYGDIIFDETEEVLLKEYFEQLKLQFCMATGRTNAEMSEVLEWFESRDSLLELFAKHTEDIWNKSKPIGFMDNTVEVGTVGKYNTVSNYLPFSSVISRYGFTVDKTQAYTFTGVLFPTDQCIEVLVGEKGKRSYPNVKDFRTFILNNPGENDIQTLNALKFLSLQKPVTMVGVYGSNKDNDFLQKSDFIKNYCDELRGFYKCFYSYLTPTISLRESEQGDMYVKTVVTSQLFNTGETPRIIQKSIRPGKRGR